MSTPDTRSDLVLRISCADRPGIVHAVSEFLVDTGCTITASQQYGDVDSGQFFMRVQFRSLTGVADRTDVGTRFEAVAGRMGMTWHLSSQAVPQRVLILASTAGHCLNDLLYRWQIGALNIDIPAVVSNHRDLERMVTGYGIAFHHVPVTSETKSDAEQRLLEMVDTAGIDLVVLARYMQVLSPAVCARLSGRAINIHHSMLPSFKGARPYHQAHRRGVKIIGATAHYVTDDLDEGPIIEQEVARIDHSLTPQEVVAIGRDVEAQALARAVRWHTEDRVLLNGGSTVVFR